MDEIVTFYKSLCYLDFVLNKQKFEALFEAKQTIKNFFKEESLRIIDNYKTAEKIICCFGLPWLDVFFPSIVHK